MKQGSGENGSIYALCKKAFTEGASVTIKEKVLETLERVFEVKELGDLYR